MTQRSRVSMATLSTVVLLSANFLPNTAKAKTGFVDTTDPAGADPLNAKYNLGINDGGMQNAVGAGTMAKTLIFSSSFSGVRDIDEVDGISEHDDAGIGLSLAPPVAAAGRQVYLQ